jgi:hypothetical protein
MLMGALCLSVEQVLMSSLFDTASCFGASTNLEYVTFRGPITRDATPARRFLAHSISDHVMDILSPSNQKPAVSVGARQTRVHHSASCLVVDTHPVYSSLHLPCSHVPIDNNNDDDHHHPTAQRTIVLDLTAEYHRPPTHRPTEFSV